MDTDPVNPPGSTPRRVKVYLLQGEDWLDNGTGYCVGEIDNGAPYFLVRNELDSEDVILKLFLEGSIQYQRQQETLIVWTDLSGKDLALSFKETEGCADLCEFIIKVQQESLSPNISLYYVIPNITEGDDITELITGPITYPEVPSNTNLESILEIINQGSNSQFTRTSILKYILDNDYFHKLVDSFNAAENDRNLINLYTLSEIIKTLILYNESSLIEEFLLTEENILALAGILEYDPEYPNFKACHRDSLDNKSFKTVIPVEDLNIFKKDFHLNFLKDVVLARFLDDQTFNLISTLIYMNQVEIINYLKDPLILEQLFNIYEDYEMIKYPRAKLAEKESQSHHNENLARKRDGVRMLHQYVLIAKSLQSYQKLEFFSLLVKSGLFRMTSFALNDSDTSIRVLGTELIVIIIEQDTSIVNSIDNDETIDNSEPPNNHRMEPTENEEETKSLKLKLSDDMTLISILTRLLVEDKNPGLKIQAFEALRILLDSNIASNSSPDIEIDQLKNELRSHSSNGNSGDDFHDINTNNYFKAFYSQVAPELYKRLIILASTEDFTSSNPVVAAITGDELLYHHLCDLISFCTKEHDVSISRPFFLEQDILLGVGKLIAISCKTTLKLSAIRCLKNITLLNDNYYTRYIIDSNMLRYFFDYFELIAEQNNMANSTCLDFIETIVKNCDSTVTIKRYNFKLLANYIYRDFKEFCGTKINHVNTGRELIELVENGFYEDHSHNNSATENTIKNDDLSFGSDDEILDRHNVSTPLNDEDDTIEEDQETNSNAINSGNTVDSIAASKDIESSNENRVNDLFSGPELKSLINAEKRPREDDDDPEDCHRVYLTKNGISDKSPDESDTSGGVNGAGDVKLSPNVVSNIANTSKKIALTLSGSERNNVV